MSTVQQNFKTYNSNFQNALNEVEKIRVVLFTCQQNSVAGKNFFLGETFYISGTHFFIRGNDWTAYIPQKLSDIPTEDEQVISMNDRTRAASIEEIYNFMIALPSIVKNVFKLCEEDAFIEINTFIKGISCDVFEDKLGR